MAAPVGFRVSSTAGSDRSSAVNVWNGNGSCAGVSHAVGMSSVWLITGAQAAGKSTVADLLARRHHHGVHVRGGQFYRWAVTGWVHAGDSDEAEARRLLDLRYRLSSTVAEQYASAGFTAVAQDNIY